jgi:hypothetical protein
MLPKDRMLRLLAINALTGAALGVGVVAAILAFDIAQLRRLIATDPAGIVALAMLTVGFVVTCASVMMGSAVMLTAHQEREGPGGGKLQPAPAIVRGKKSRP